MITFLRKPKVARVIAFTLILNVLGGVAAPPAQALTGGPSAPEFSSFEPVATTDMVNPFSGDFNYNLPVLEIPGPDGGGYALSLSYHSGTTSEEEASWAGHGWTLNPGAINRSTRGFPDDYKNVAVQQYNQTRPNWSASITNSLGMEIFSADAAKNFYSLGTLSANTALRFNNYQGFARTYGFGISPKGMGSLNMNLGAQGPTFSAEINFAGILADRLNKGADKTKYVKSQHKDAFSKETLSKSIEKTAMKAVMRSASNVSRAVGSTYGIYNFSEAVQATGITKLDENMSRSINYSLGVSVNPFSAPVGFQTGFYGNYNRQLTEAFRENRAYGYLHNPHSNVYNDRTLSDYSVEKGNPFKKRDLYLGIPFNNADQYMVTGEGLSGGFRFYPKKQGHFYPNFIENKTKISQAGFDLGFGGGISIGFNFGSGTQKSKVGNWVIPGLTGAAQFETGGAFRFANDLGGSVSYGTSGNDAAALLATSPVLKQTIPALPTSLTPLVSEAAFSNTSAIDHHTHGQLATFPGIRFNKSANQQELLDDQGSNPERVTEMTVWNADGMQYVYGLPTYARNETNLHFNVDNPPADKYLAYRDIPLFKAGKKYVAAVSNRDYNNVVLGEIRTEPYATSHLLTQIVTPDYVDVNGNGADNPDLGGWTQFHYRKRYGTKDQDWYRWRTPYNGLLYNPGQIADTKDDRGTLLTGEKEVYYLKAVETRTHIAYFVTNKAQKSSFTTGVADQTALAIDAQYLQGSQQDRRDGLGADLKGGRPDTKGTQQLEYLEKIVLFAKSRPERPLKTIRFAYDYSQVRNLPNHTDGRYPQARTTGADNSGKLTLKRVWFEYEGAVNARISPYEFMYAYKPAVAFSESLRKRYPEATGISGRFTPEAQNPDYAPHLLDPWGNLQRYGKERSKYLIPWVYQGEKAGPSVAAAGRTWTAEVPQTATPPAAQDFDPAAWQLKGIKLPSGAEVLVQYEQKDYAYVQNRRPMAMASLLAAQEPIVISTDASLLSGKTSYGLQPTYTVNARDLGLSPSDPDAVYQQQLDVLKAYFEKEKIYFKFLYSLKGSPSEGAMPDLDNCQSEYITGYASADPAGIAIVTVNGEKHFQIRLNGETYKDAKTSYEAVPRQACYDYYTTQRMGKWDNGCVSDMEAKYDEKAVEEGSLVTKAAGIIAEMQGKLLQFKKYDIPEKSTIGERLHLGLSFLKLPMLKAKKGGGVRVKRLLVFDPGVEDGDEGLYGQEFLYQDFDRSGETLTPISSGVATNEPPEAREENPLVHFMPRKKQSFYSRITAGEDKEQTEGPLGETVLPGASVGHSRVVVRNIHQGPSGTGFTVQSFNTVKDYPYDGAYEGGGDFDLAKPEPGVVHTPLGSNLVKDFLIIPAGLFYYERNQVWAAQAYRFLINNMHGQPREVATYAGDYPFAGNAPLDQAVFSRLTRIGGQEYVYYKPGEKVKMLQKDGTFKMELPGKETDVTMEMKSVTDQTTDLSIEVDITIGLAPPIPVYVTPGLSFELSDKGISTHVITKVIRYPVLTKQVISYQDGVKSVSENLAFNPHTGLPVLSRTADQFDGVKIGETTWDGGVYALTLPASWYYPEMGPKFAAGSLLTNRSNQLSAAAGQVTTHGAGSSPLRTGTSTWTTQPLTRVLSANAQTFAKGWLEGTTLTPTQQLLINGSSLATVSAADKTKALEKLNASWRPRAQYVYRTDVLSANATNKVYSGGVYNNFTMFNNWLTGEPAEPWLKTNQIENYSTDGNPVQEFNAMNIRSAARFGPHRLPVAMATNARYGAIGFEDFENNAALPPNESQAHSGSRCLAVDPAAGNRLLLSGLLVDEELQRKGALLKLWVKTALDVPGCQLALLDGAGVALPLGASLPLNETTRIARTGDWTLHEVAVPAGAFATPGTAFTVQARTTSPVSLDDVRFQPREAQGTCYVYDVKTLRLITQFDDQHFGLYYQYNDEGKLVRKMIETERGMKTVQETQYNMPKVPRF